MNARRVVTLPPSLDAAAALEFAQRARRAGAELLELRTDLHAFELPADALAAELPLLIAERQGRYAPESWRRRARLLDRELPAWAASVLSHHAARPLEPDEALALWTRQSLPERALLKHVEPLGPAGSGGRLLATQAKLTARFGAGRVTVLATGPCALPIRAVLAEKNALDFLALEADWAAAPGQRLLEDAVRAARSGGGPRLGILGNAIAHSRSPRLHAQPFDRIELPEDAPIGEVLEALRPYYRGLAVTRPFKKQLAAHLGSSLAGLNTLVRTEDGWRAENTDVLGAEEVLRRLDAKRVTVLGDGGATVALRMAAGKLGVELQILRRAEINGAAVRGSCVWTWPAGAAAPASLKFEGAKVAVIAYGAPARSIAAEIRVRGGEPLLLGRRWFVAQARAQRELWRSA